MNKNRIIAGVMAAAVAVGMSGGLTSLTTLAAETQNGFTAKTERISEGIYDAYSANGIVIDDSESGHNGVLVVDSDYTISDATILLNTDADGTDTCDFSGKGTAVAVFGDSDVLIEDSYIETTGVATMPIFNDTGSTVTVKDSTMISNGGTIYQSYLNTAAQNVMVAPPWILGIMGTSRCTNLEGQDSTLNVYDSDTQSGAWAVLSTDSGSNMYLNAYNTSLTLNNADESLIPIQEEGGQIVTKDNPYTTRFGAGYGTYAIGSAVETFAGATLNVGTYSTIFTGGSATLKGIEEGQTYEVAQADGSAREYVASETKNTVVNSDTFGFMFHQGDNTLDIQDGTEINSNFATFLMKTGSSNEHAVVTVDGADIENGGVLIQLMDNDDATNPAPDMGVPGYSGPVFATTHTENPGFNTAQAAQDSATQDFIFTNGIYEGNIYNASGSDASTVKSLNGSPLNLVLGEGAVLNGAAASTAAIHVTYDGSQFVKNTMGGAAANSQEEVLALLDFQNTEYTISEYFDQGHVANLINDNGANDINIMLTDDAVWTVSGDSLIDTLAIFDDAKVVVEEDATLTVGTKKYPGGTILTAENIETAEAETVEEVTEKPAEGGGGGDFPGGGPGGPGGGPGGPGGGDGSKPEGCIGSWTGGDPEDYAYDAALSIYQTVPASELEAAESLISNLQAQIKDLEATIEELIDLAGAGWQLNDAGEWIFVKADGELAKGWQQFDGEWFYLDKTTGVMQTGWIKDGNVWYYLHGNGVMASEEWVGGYWLGADGAWTYAPIGTWKKDSTGWWFGDTSGWYAKDQIQIIDCEAYAFNSSGYWIQ